MRRLLRSPRTLFYHFIDRCYARYVVQSNGAKLQGNVKFRGITQIRCDGNSRIIIGKNVSFFSRGNSSVVRPLSPCHIATLSHNAYVEIGENTAMTGIRIYSAVSVVIGKRCLIGTGTMILDTDGHELDPINRKANPSSRGILSPINIGDDVLVGAHVIILKGANIGSGSVVGAGSVVTGKFPERSIIAGNPARLIRTME